MATSYTFSISVDIAAQKLDVARLSDDIRASAITIALAGITHIGAEDNFTVEFKADLDVANAALLITVVRDTSGEPLPGTATRADGVALVQLEPSGESSSLRAKGIAGAIAPALVDGNAVRTSVVWEPLERVSFQGVPTVDVRDGDKRDYMDLCVIFPADETKAKWEAIPELGPWLFGAANTPAEAGQNDIVLTKFGETIYVTHNGTVEGSIAEGVSVITPPMKLVVDYYAHAVGVAPWVAAQIRYWVG